MAALTRPDCSDFQQFQDILKKMRRLDDTIVNNLNNQLPTDSFTSLEHCQSSCKELFKKFDDNSSNRQQALSRCLEYYGGRVSDLKSKREKDESNISLLKELRKEQNKIRLLQTELGVEEIVKERTAKVLYERCRPYYVPESLRI